MPKRRTGSVLSPVVAGKLDGRVKAGGQGFGGGGAAGGADILELIAARHVGYDVDVELLL